MKKLLSLTLAIALLSGCQQKQEQTKEDPNLITCERIGVVKLTYSHEDLVNEIGAEKLEDGTVENSGETIHITKVFPNQPEEIVVYWSEKEQPYKTITKISTGVNFGPYKTADGIFVGATLEELRKFNNFQPVSMSNFFTSLDGFADIKGYNGGDIETNLPCLGGKLDIVKQRGVDINMLDEVKKEEEIKSSHAIFATLEVEVVELSISPKQ